VTPDFARSRRTFKFNVIVPAGPAQPMAASTMAAVTESTGNEYCVRES